MTGTGVRVGVVVLSVFAVGLVAGIALERHHRVPSLSSLTNTDAHETAMAELRDVVGLDEQQMEQVDAIIAQNQQVVQQMWEQLRPEVQTAMRDVHSQIAALLRPDQTERFHEWLMLRVEQGEALPH